MKKDGYNMLQQFLQKLESKIKSAYTEGVTMDEAEKLAAEFLHAQMVIAGELRKKDLDSRMRKSGLKAIRAAVYHQIVSSSEKKPTEGAIEHSLNLDKDVASEQDAYDNAEVEKDELERYYNICREGHIYFRGIAKGVMS